MITYDLTIHQNLPKYQALYTLMREDIAAGVLPSGYRLPSRRAFAEHLGVSTATIDHAYQQLAAEGYVQSRERSGYFVAQIDSPRPQKLPDRAITLCDDPVPDIDNPSGFEYSVMTKLMREVIAKYDRILLQKTPHNGCAALRNARADVLHVTPFHSFPSGVTAPASRRMEYLAWAAARSAVLIEDDFDSEFAAKGLPPETLYSMDGGENVIYLNTFSKSLSPSMRIGYMVLPERLHILYEERLGFYSCTVPAFDQYLLAEYISRGFFERHLNRLRKRLREKRGR